MSGLRGFPPQVRSFTPIHPSKSQHLFPPSILTYQNPNYISASSISISSTTLRRFQALKFRIYCDGNKNGGERGYNGGKTDEWEVNNGGQAGPRLNVMKTLMDLVLDPDRDNIVAVGLTGLLTWASVQVLWQLFLISAAILIAALKYTIVAALLIFILIALL